MNKVSCICCVLLIVISSCSFGQTPQQLKIYAKGDSLSRFQFKKALEVFNPLINNLNDKNKGEHILKIKALQRKAHCLEQQDNLKEALIISLNVIDQSEKEGLVETQYLALITVALIHEKNGALNTCLSYLNKAENLLQKHQLNSKYPLFYVRKSSYYRINNQPDSAKIYAHKALKSAVKYNDILQEADAHLLLGILSSSKKENIKQLSLATSCFSQNKDSLKSAGMYNNISVKYIEDANLDKALLYSDSAILFTQNSQNQIVAFAYEHRAELYEKLNNKDSALFYYKLYIKYQLLEWEKIKNAEIVKIQAANESAKKEEEIQYQKKINTKQEQLIFLWILLFIIATLTFIVLFMLYYRLKTKNKTITKQAKKLEESIFHKKILLAEVQHRVKNNLQLIIGLLEIQKEKVNQTPVDELIHESQNRVKSMAFLHHKLNFFANEENVDFNTYLQNITTLLKDTYGGLNKNIEFIVNSQSKHISIDESIPLGLILVELITNSMKFAFKDKNEGIIKIAVYDTPKQKKKRMLIYQDNGIGFNKEEINKGTGFEIIEGLVNQLKGNTHSFIENGYKIEIRF